MTKLTPQIQNQICAYIAEGMNKSDTCAAVGIDRRTLYRWLKKGEAKEDEQYTNFYNAHQTALQSSYHQLIQRVLDGDTQVRTELDADGNVLKIIKTETRSWRSAAWLLEKRFPYLFGKTGQELSTSGQTPQPLPNYAALVELVKQFERRNETEA